MDGENDRYLRLNGLEKGLVLLEHGAQLVLEKNQLLGDFVLLAAAVHIQALNRHVLRVDQSSVARHVTAAYVGDHHIVDYCFHVAFIAQCVLYLEHALVRLFR